MSGVQILLSDGRGVYIPRDFAESCSHWKGIHAEDLAILERGPDHENSQDYWEVWEMVEREAYYTDAQGNTWRLYQDGDLFAYCEPLMTDEEYYNFFGEHRSALDLEDYWPHRDENLDSDSRLETDNWYDTSAELNS